VAFPGDAEGFAGLEKSTDQVRVGRVAQPGAGLGPEGGDVVAAGEFPVGQQLTQVGVGKQQPQQVAVGGCDGRYVRVKRRVCGVPC
jgi:hypothetical protein